MSHDRRLDDRSWGGYLQVAICTACFNESVGLEPSICFTTQGSPAGIRISIVVCSIVHGLEMLLADTNCHVNVRSQGGHLRAAICADLFGDQGGPRRHLCPAGLRAQEDAVHWRRDAGGHLSSCRVWVGMLLIPLVLVRKRK